MLRSVLNDRRNLLRMRFIDGVARALEYDRVAVSARVVPLFELGLMIRSAPATIAQLGLVVQAAAVSGVVNAVAAVNKDACPHARGHLFTLHGDA
jgi:hypothetical protein